MEYRLGAVLASAYDADHETLGLSSLTVFEGAVNRLEKPSLLRVHTCRLSRSDGKERRIEGGDVLFDQMRLPNVDLNKS